jgi:hypothetical protein
VNSLSKLLGDFPKALPPEYEEGKSYFPLLGVSFCHLGPASQAGNVGF